MHLKRQIEELIKAGKLSHIIKELKQGSGKDQPKAAKKGETSGKDKAMAILIVPLWKRVARKRVTQSLSPDPEILFPSLKDEDGAEGPMIIEAEIGGHFIHRIYVDGGSASEILYEHCFNMLRLEILLPVKIGDAKHSTSTWMNFVVVRSPSPYNGIIGRPGVKKIQAVPSTAHGIPEAQPSDVTRAAEERIKVAIHPEYPEQTIAIGSSLTEEGRKEFGTSAERLKRMSASKVKEKKPSIREKQGNTKRSRKACRLWHHKGIPLPQLVIKSDNGKEA
ncbi:hypothetical protein Tco_1396432 [Tanacetum coccineum]